MPTINWNSVPDYDEWGVDNYWTCEDWIIWHQKLSNHFGDKIANDIWNYSYAQSGQFSSNLNCRTFNSQFRKYVLEKKLDPYANAGILAPVLQGFGTGQDVISGTFKGVSSFFTQSKVKTVLNIALIVGVVLAGAYAYKAFKKQ